MVKFTIQGVEYELAWNVGSLIRYRKLMDDSDGDLEQGLKILFCMLPKGSFESWESLADGIEIDQLESLTAAVTEATAKKKNLTDSN